MIFISIFIHHVFENWFENKNNLNNTKEKKEDLIKECYNNDDDTEINYYYIQKNIKWSIFFIQKGDKNNDLIIDKKNKINIHIYIKLSCNKNIYINKILTNNKLLSYFNPLIFDWINHSEAVLLLYIFFIFYYPLL